MTDYMFDWFPFMGFGTIFSTIVSLTVAYLVYRDAEKRGMNGLLWGLPILIPWIGILFLIFYLIMRDSERSRALLAGTSRPGSGQTEGTQGAGGAKRPGSAALELLNERYARGEVTREVYLQMKEDIKADMKEDTKEDTKEDAKEDMKRGESER